MTRLLQNLTTPTRRRGFTLVEVLVVVGIIAILVSLLLVGTSMARKAARKARTSADMQTIATALEAYKQDFGDYPRLNYTGTPSIDAPVAAPNPLLLFGDARYIAASELLAWALVGPYDAAPNPYVAPVAWHPYDGKTSFGFRVGVSTRGTVYGPYLDAERFLHNPVNDPPEVNQMFRYYYFLHDNFRQPILYFVRNAKPETNQIRTIADATRDIYNFNDNGIAFVRNDTVDPFERFKVMVNYRKAEGPYLLWSAGEDEQFAVEDPTDATAVEKCDDVLFWGGQ